MIGTLLALAAQGTIKVLLAGLLLGAGLPAIFALGIRALAWGKGGKAEVSRAEPQRWGLLIAGLCFAIVVGGVLLGLIVIISSGFGYELTFEGILPTLQKED
ncbi:MAG: hypothetical protein Q4P07_09030 [Ornithinimicrobium sp.]|uniref:hypothetical protein n=1 Tax=Ornithinimicrobium sp. TaxID=1977084 RepID=UPI0026DF76A2|nr:hypothetical protein [Ornithinimicrobium sp.]MDO5740279.1 hypothetical protein [Ornithinimicrobium sp.]